MTKNAQVFSCAFLDKILSDANFFKSNSHNFFLKQVMYKKLVNSSEGVWG